MGFANRLGWIGVDIGTHTVKVAQTVRTASGLRMHKTAVVQRLDPWADDDSLALDSPDTSWSEICAAIECGRFFGRSAACVLPMNVCEMRGMKIPQGETHERRAMIASELADDEGDQPIQKEFDYWELGEMGQETAEGFNVNVMSVSRPWIERVASDCRRARLDCWAVDGAPLAMARAVTLAARPRSTDRLLAVDWGFSNTTLCVVGKGRPLYARRLHDCNFRKALWAVEQSLGVTLDHAQHIVDLHGVVPLHGDDSGDREIQGAITLAMGDVVESLVAQIERTLRFAETQRRYQHPLAVWLMGGGASARNIGPHLSKALGMPVSIWGLPTDSVNKSVATGRHAALFGTAAALSALAWRDP